MDFKKVTVLMSSYNGEEYIREQIESILNQTNVVVRLIVRDDGSTDSTVQILEDYKKRGLLDYYTGNNLGWRQSFMQLVYNAPESDYYAFSDQDDIWMPEKLSAALTSLDSLTEGPNLYVSNSYYWKGDIKVLTNDLMPNVSKDRCLIWNLGPGCTMVFNKSLHGIVKDRPIKCTEIAHDHWLLCSAYVLGRIFYDMNSYILYRQHGNNQLGTTIYVKEKYLLKLKQFRELRNNHYIEDLSRQILLCYDDIMACKMRESCLSLACYRDSLYNYLKLLFTNKFNHESFVTTLGLKLRILLRHL